MIVGVLGGGQLGRMLALAGYPLGLAFRFLEPASHAAVSILADVYRGEYDDPNALAAFPPQEVTVATTPLSIPVGFDVAADSTTVTAWTD